MLRPARYALMISAGVYLLAVGSGVIGLIEPLASMTIGAYSAIVMGIAALACVAVQLLGLVRRRR